MDDDDMVPEVTQRQFLFTGDGQRHLNLVLREVARMGGFFRKGRAYAGRGRGAGAACVLALGEARTPQRVVRVAPRIVRVKGRLPAAQQHLRYLQRDGVGRDTLRGTLYDGQQERADGRGFLERSRSDTHQFRIVVAVEHGWEYPSLRHLTRRLLEEMELDLGSKLEWVAADHYNTGLPHTHVVLRGIDECGQELRIARDYLRQGMSHRAAKIVQLDLGPPDGADPRKKLFAETQKQAPTAFESRLATLADAHGYLVLAGRGFDSFDHCLLAARLQTLKALGLAEELRGGRWQLLAHASPTLEALAARGVRLDILQREITRHALVRTARERAIFDPLSAGREALVGCMLGQGRGKDGRNFLVVDGHDGRSYFVDMGFLAPLSVAPEAILVVTPRQRAPNPTDHTIAAVAQSHDGYYSLANHQAYDPALAPGEGERHVQRLMMLDAQLGLKELAPGLWQLEKDFLARITRFAWAQARLYPVDVRVLSEVPLTQVMTMEAPCWPMQKAAFGLALSYCGFGRKLRDALEPGHGACARLRPGAPEITPVIGLGLQPSCVPLWGGRERRIGAGRHDGVRRDGNDTNF